MYEGVCLQFSCIHLSSGDIIPLYIYVQFLLNCFVGIVKMHGVSVNFVE
jgi:hypothetical protein